MNFDFTPVYAKLTIGDKSFEEEASKAFHRIAAIEEAISAAPEYEQGALLIEAVQEWLKEDGGLDIPAGAAEAWIILVHNSYEEHKKKLPQLQTLPQSITSTRDSSTVSPFEHSGTISQGSVPGQNSKSGNQTQDLPQTD